MYDAQYTAVQPPWLETQETKGDNAKGETKTKKNEKEKRKRRGKEREDTRGGWDVRACQVRGAQAHTLSPPPFPKHLKRCAVCVPLAYVCASYLATRVDRLRHVAFVNATEDALGLRQSLHLVFDLCRRNERRVRHCSLLLSWEKEEPRKERQRAQGKGLSHARKTQPTPHAPRHERARPPPHETRSRSPLPLITR